MQPGKSSKSIRKHTGSGQSVQLKVSPMMKNSLDSSSSHLDLCYKHNEEDERMKQLLAAWDDEEEDINIAIESCPVDCIHFVKENNLPILEYAMSKCERTSVASMMSGSARVDDPFDVANQMIRRGVRRSKRGEF